MNQGDGRVAIVTGGAGGIGRAYVRGLVDAGYRVAVADLADPAPVAAEAAAGSGDAIAVEVDVADVASTEAMAATVLERFGRIDALVNNAAFFSRIVKRPFDEIDPDEWDAVFRVNVRGAWLCARAVAPAMRRQGGGRIVNTSSMTFHGGGISGFAHYASSKAAIVGLTRLLARELGDDHIAVNTISPDYVEHEGELFRRQPEMAGILAAQRCFKRPEQAEDLVGTLLFLLGPGSAFITGQDIWVNGGRMFS